MNKWMNVKEFIFILGSDNHQHKAGVRGKLSLSFDQLTPRVLGKKILHYLNCEFFDFF